MKTNTFDNSQYFSENELIKQFQLLSKEDIAKILIRLFPKQKNEVIK